MRTSIAVMALAGALGLLVAVGLSVPATPDGTERTGRGVRTTPADGTTTTASSGPTPLFNPEDLTLLEGPDRDRWQRPELVMDQLHIADGSRVADIGAGAGWFTIRLAQRVRENGMVYAQDLQPEMVNAISRRVGQENLHNVVVIQGREDSPNLPAGVMLDAILVVDVYPEVSDRVRFLRSLAVSLKPRGRIGIVNYRPDRGGPGPEPSQRLASEVVVREAAAADLRQLTPTINLRYQYLIVLGR